MTEHHARSTLNQAHTPTRLSPTQSTSTHTSSHSSHPSPLTSLPTQESKNVHNSPRRRKRAWLSSPFTQPPSSPSSSNRYNDTLGSPNRRSAVRRKYEARHFALSLPSPSSPSSSSSPSLDDPPTRANSNSKSEQKKSRRGMGEAPTGRLDGGVPLRRNEVGSDGTRWKGKAPAVRSGVEARMERANRVSQTSALRRGTRARQCDGRRCHERIRVRRLRWIGSGR